MTGTRRRLLAGACCGLVVMGLASGALRGGNGGDGGGREQRRLSQYSIPKVHGYPIDYCLHYEESHYGPGNSLVSRRGDGCGKPAADKFCQMEGYPEAEYSTAIYYSSNATWVLGDDELNPRDEGMSKGEHTWFDRISCLDWQYNPPAVPNNSTQPQPQPAGAAANASRPLAPPLPPANATQPKQQQQGAGKR